VIKLPLKRLDPSVELPSYAREGDAGLDLRAAHDATLEPGHRGLVGTGLAVAIPVGFAGLVLPRSGLALAQGVTVLNAPGLGDQPIVVRRGDRIAQLVIQAVERAELVEVGELPASERGAGGFGSTGV
jgi:dUTP diphosphatase